MGVRCNAEQPKSSAKIQQNNRKFKDPDLLIRQVTILSKQAFTDLKATGSGSCYIKNVIKSIPVDGQINKGDWILYWTITTM